VGTAITSNPKIKFTKIVAKNIPPALGWVLVGVWWPSKPGGSKMGEKFQRREGKRTGGQQIEKVAKEHRGDPGVRGAGTSCQRVRGGGKWDAPHGSTRLRAGT